MNWRVLVVTLGVGIVAMMAVPQALAQTSTPCAAPTAVVTGDVYDPNQPIGLGGSGNLTTTFDMAETDDESLSFVIGYVGDGRFSVSLTDPNGDQREVFTAIHPANSLSSISAQQSGRYTVTVEADAPWTVIIQ
jgi:hypothetical protein